jgi:hypothetical protein
MAIQRITSGIIADGAIVATDIGDNTVTTSKIADANVTSSKLDSTLSISGNFLANNITANTNIVANTGSATAPSIFPTGDTNTGIFFPAADTIAFAEGGAEAMRIDANGNVGIGTTSPSGKLHVVNTLTTGSTDDNLLAYFSSSNRNSSVYIIAKNTESSGLYFGDPDNNQIGYAAYDHAGNYLRFATNGSERARIDSSGNIYTSGNYTVQYPGENNTTTGIFLESSGKLGVSRDNTNPFYVNRNTSDGTLISMRTGGNEQGTISVSGGTVSYNQFMGSHWATLTDWSRPDIKIGTILDSINELVIYKYALIEVEEEIPAKKAVLDENGNEIEPAVEAHIGPVQKKICYNGNAEVGATVSVEYEGETYEGIVELERDREFTKGVKVKINDTAASKAVYGVFVAWNNDKNGDGGIWNDMYVGAVGNYVVRMAEGQEPQIGDLIEADGNGCGVVQEDDIIRSKTVGKVTSNIPQVTYEDGSFLVTCVLYSG